MGSTYPRIVVSCLLAIFAAPASAAIQFEDVSAETGMTGFTESWGASWADYNADNWWYPNTLRILALEYTKYELALWRIRFANLF